jgi:hypothetical protein
LIRGPCHQLFSRTVTVLPGASVASVDELGEMSFETAVSMTHMNCRPFRLSFAENDSCTSRSGDGST